MWTRIVAEMERLLVEKTGEGEAVHWHRAAVRVVSKLGLLLGHELTIGGRFLHGHS